MFHDRKANPVFQFSSDLINIFILKTLLNVLNRIILLKK